MPRFPLSLSFSHKTAAKAFLVGTSGPKGQVEFWQFLKSVYSLFGFGNHVMSSSFHFSGLGLSLVPAPDVPPQSQKSSSENGESANSHNSHKFLHLTSWNPRIHHKRISRFLSLAYQPIFNMQSHATQLTDLCADAVIWVTLPVIFVLEEVGGRVRCFYVCICEGSSIKPFLEGEKISKIPQPLPPQKK